MTDTKRDPNTQWDIVSSVGLTALAVAAGRAIETQREDPLITDPYAGPLVQAARSGLPAEMGDLDAEMQRHFEESSYMGVRSRFFDEFFAAATGDGIRQVVILASGLDTRPQRLDWPEGTVVFEIDQPLVLQFKDHVLRKQGVTATSDHHPVQVDLRDDWSSALLEAGFDRTEPTAWLAEGLLPYLPAAAEGQLLRTIHELSAPGSRASIECFADPAKILNSSNVQAAREQGLDMAQLFNLEERPAPDDEMTAHGWKVQRDPSAAVAESYGRPLSGAERETSDQQYFLTATLPE
jgi:methyltransferase (TIGR00027 family)